MNLTNNIYSIIALVIDLLKSINIFPGFTLFNAISFLMWASVINWVMGALFGVINFHGGGSDDS